MKSTDKLTDKIFMKNVYISVACILICIIALCSATYAWFTGTAQSTGNNITMGTFELDIKVERIDTVNGTATPVDTNVLADGIVTATLAEVGTTYRITLTRKITSTSNGYCYVKVGSGSDQPTSTITDVQGTEADFVFTVTPTEADTAVKLTPRWGINAHPVIENGAVAPVIVNN